MKRALLVTWLLGLLAGCGEGASTPADEDRPDWTVVAADGVSAGEMSLRSWCDPGSTLTGVASSSEGMVTQLRSAAAKVRSQCLETSDEGAGVAHDALVTLAEFSAAVHYVASMMTTEAFIPPDESRSKFEYFALGQKAVIFSEMTEKERDEMRAGKDVWGHQLRAIDKVIARQKTAVAAALDKVTQTQREIEEPDDTSYGDGPIVKVDSAVVARASTCVRALVDKRMPSD